jgi:hypothetical protein
MGSASCPRRSSNRPCPATASQTGPRCSWPQMALVPSQMECNLTCCPLKSTWFSPRCKAQRCHPLPLACTWRFSPSRLSPEKDPIHRQLPPTPHVAAAVPTETRRLGQRPAMQVDRPYPRSPISLLCSGLTQLHSRQLESRTQHPEHLPPVRHEIGSETPRGKQQHPSLYGRWNAIPPPLTHPRACRTLPSSCAT